MVAEVEVARAVERHKMDMNMRYVDAHHSLAHLDTWANLLETLGYTLGEKVQFTEELVVEVEDIVHLFLGDAKYMATDNGVDVEESETMLSFGDFVAGDFSRHYFTENSCHYLSILVSSKVILPAGTFTSTMSPTL